MTTNPTLEHTREIKKITDDLLIGEQLASIHVYLDDVLSRLEWQHYIWTRLKKELGAAGRILLGMVLGIVIPLPHISAH